MLQNWTDGLQTFEKWLEYFQVAEMHWHFFLGKKKKKKRRINKDWSPSYPHQSFMFFGFIFVLVTLIFFLSIQGPGRQKGDSIL